MQGTVHYPFKAKKWYPKSVLDRKLVELSKKAGDWAKASHDYPEILRHNSVENAIEVFGDYNPIYAGRPKKLALQLLEGAAGRRSFVWYLVACGLAYITPTLIGVRKRGIRTSYVGLELLDHWAGKFPKFKPFVDAYVNEKARRRIKSDCVDLMFNALPQEWEEAEKKNVGYLQKAIERDRRKAEKERMKFLADQAHHQQVYQGAINTVYSTIGKPDAGTWPWK